jgi:RNA polymerase sigma-70 factor, ECF subfamily
MKQQVPWKSSYSGKLGIRQFVMTKKLIGASGESCPRVFDVLYHRYLLAIYCYLRLRPNSGGDAANLTQQVFLQALIALSKYR